MKLVKFSTVYGFDRYVNADKILYVEGNEYATTLFVVDNQIIQVDASIAEVVAKLMG